MDIIIEKRKPKSIKFVIFAVIALAIICGAYGLANSDFGAPSVDQDKIRIGTVKRGSLDVLVSGNGVVTAKNPEWIVSKVSGQVITSSFKAGEFVKKGDVILELVNDDIVSAHTKSESELRATKADYTALKINLDVQLVDYESDLQKAELDAEYANSIYGAVKILWDKGNPPISKIEFLNASLKARQTQSSVEIAKKKLATIKETNKVQLDAFRFRLESAEEENNRFKNRMNNLKITANSDGIIQNLNLKVGQSVNTGDGIAQIINPLSTYITLSVPAVQAFKLATMQKVNIELNKKIIQGIVHRIDPNVKGTTVDVDVYFDEEVKDAKVGMFVNGTIFIQSIADTLYVEIPSQMSENGNMSIFLVSPDEKFAELTTVKSGALSSSYLQIVSGLKEGDKVILSDFATSNYTNKLRLN